MQWSTLECQDYKGFVRFKFSQNGDVELFAVGVKKTPRTWKQLKMNETTEDYPALFRPADMPEMEYQLVDHVIIKKTTTSLVEA